MELSFYWWVGFNIFILILLALDLGVFHRKSKEITVLEAFLWTGFWVILSFGFNIIVYYRFGPERAFEYFTGYLIEKSLSVDNIFVMILIFSYFQVPQAYQHKVLYWGILGALVMRGAFIYAGVELIHVFHWLAYIFGAFLIYTGIKILTSGEIKLDPRKNPLLKFSKRFFHVTEDFVKDRFIVRIDGRIWATPLFLVVIVIESSDLVFAVDSIPAILAISDNAFIVYTSNVFAILGLRSLYFALAGLERYFKYLKYGISAILTFVGIKMAIVDIYKIPIVVSLAFIFMALALATLASMIFKAESNESKL
jgi:tellurite resistance protein TerC